MNIRTSKFMKLVIAIFFVWILTKSLQMVGLRPAYTVTYLDALKPALFFYVLVQIGFWIGEQQRKEIEESKQLAREAGLKENTIRFLVERPYTLIGHFEDVVFKVYRLLRPKKLEKYVVWSNYETGFAGTGTSALDREPPFEKPEIPQLVKRILDANSKVWAEKKRVAFKKAYKETLGETLEDLCLE